MSDFYRDSAVRKARKDHRCIYCGAAIQTGEKHREQTGVWDGKAFRNRFHFECWDALCDDECGADEFMPYSGEPPERLRARTA